MNLTWYGKNNVTNDSKLTDGCQLINKLLSYDPESKNDNINIIFGKKEYFNSFLDNIKNMASIFSNLNFRLGVIENGQDIEKISGELIESSVIYIGDDAEEKKYLSVFNDSACIISKKCYKDFTSIAYQRHLSSINNPNSVSLSELREDFSLAESKVRASKAIFLKKDAIKKQDSYSSRSRITGLDVYECCQLIRYCGLSSEHNFFYINAEEENMNQDIWDIITTTVWYYLEGRINKNIDNQTDNHKVYMVDCDFYEEAITFIMSDVTKRWWFIHPSTEEKIPCSENDYNSLKNGNIPDLMSVHLFGLLNNA